MLNQLQRRKQELMFPTYHWPASWPAALASGSPHLSTRSPSCASWIAPPVAARRLLPWPRYRSHSHSHRHCHLSRLQKRPYRHRDRSSYHHAGRQCGGCRPTRPGSRHPTATTFLLFVLSPSPAIRETRPQRARAPCWEKMGGPPSGSDGSSVSLPLNTGRIGGWWGKRSGEPGGLDGRVTERPGGATSARIAVREDSSYDSFRKW